MFFNALILTKKGPLGKIWLAAHYRKKLSKKDIIKVNVTESVEAILGSRVLLSLRTSSHLLYGVSYLLHKQVSYLLNDALEYAYRLPSHISNQRIDLDDQSDNIREINLSVDNLELNLIPETVETHDFKIANVGRMQLQGDEAEIVCDEFEDSDIGLLRGDRDPRESVHVEEIYFEDCLITDDGFGGNLDQDPTTIFDLHSEANSSSAAEVRDKKSPREPIVDLPEAEPQQIVDDQLPEVGPKIVFDLFDERSQAVPENDIPDIEQTQEDVNIDYLAPKAGPSNAASSIEEARLPSPVRFSRAETHGDELILDPIDESYHRPKRRRNLRVIVDRVTEISKEAMLDNIHQCRFTPQPEFAPSTKYLMMTKTTGSASAILNKSSTRCFASSKLNKMCFQAGPENLNDEELPSRSGDFNIPRDEPMKAGESWLINDKVHIDEIPQPEVVPEQEVIVESASVPVLDINEPEVRPPSPEKASQRPRKKRPRLSQEQARRATVYEPELLNPEFNIEFEKTQMDVDPHQDVPHDIFSASLSQSEYSSTPEEGVLSQLSQTLSDPVTFSHLTKGYNRKMAALTFFQLLTLHKQNVIILDQEQFYDEIYIKKGPNFRGAIQAH